MGMLETLMMYDDSSWENEVICTRTREVCKGKTTREVRLVAT